MNRLTDQAIIKLCHDVQIGTGGMDYADALTAIGKEMEARGEERELLPHIWIASYRASKYASVLCRGLNFRSIHDSKESAENISRDPHAINFTITEYEPAAPPLPYQAKEPGR